MSSTNITESNKITLDDISSILKGDVLKLATKYLKFIIEDLSFLQNPQTAKSYNGKYYVAVKDKDSKQATLVYNQEVLDRANESSTVSKDVSIDIWIDNMFLNNSLSLVIVAGGIKEHGVSQQEIKRRKIFEYCKSKNYFNRVKKPLPTIIKKIALITTDGSTISSDISEQIGLKKENIDFHTCSSNAQSLADTLKNAIDKNLYDVIALFRGGREDDAMFIFSDINVIEIIVNSPVPIITGIGHEVDAPIVQQVADVGYSTPTALAKEIGVHNLYPKKRSLELMEQSNMLLHHFFKLISSKVDHISNLNQNLLSEQLSSKTRRTMFIKENIQSGISYEIRSKDEERLFAIRSINSFLSIEFEKSGPGEISKSISNKLISELTKKKMRLVELQNGISKEIQLCEHKYQEKESSAKNNKLVIIIIVVSAVALISLYLVMK